MAEKRTAPPVAAGRGDNVVMLADHQHGNLGRDARAVHGARFARGYKALLLAKISTSAKAVGGCLLAHCNSISGRCDPSVARLARLLDMSRATVMRATAELCEAGFFEKSRHGGRSNTCQLSPVWRAFEAFVLDYETRAAGGEKVAKLQPERLQNCNRDGRRIAIQTHIRNHSDELMHWPGEGGCGWHPANRQGPGAVAIEAAKARLSTGLIAAGETINAAALNLPDAVFDLAARMEMASPGGGLRMVIEAIKGAISEGVA
jgi:DNA-binding MarR family transcriptional regulator